MPRYPIWLLTLAIGPSWADTPADLPPLEVTGTPAATDFATLEPAQIEASPSLGLTELLRQLPGVHIDRLGGRGAVSSLYLRGADPNFTAIYIDGVRVNDPTNTRGGSVDLAGLTAESIERIELLSGPASALLGADALAGAINIVTRRSDRGPGADALFASGAGGLRRGAGGLTGAAGGLGYALRAGALESGDAVAGSAAAIESFGANLDLDLPLQLSVQHARSDLRAFPDDSGGPRYAERRVQDRRLGDETIVGLRSRWVADNGVGLTLHGGLFERRELATSPGVAPGSRDLLGIPASRVDSRLTRRDARLALDAERGGLAVIAGVHGGAESGSSDGELDLPVLGDADFALEREFVAGFVDADYRWDNGLLAEASVRRDDHGAWVPTTRRVRVSYPLGALTLSAGYAEGFKLPSFYALGNPTVGNPALQPEESRSREAALQYSREAVDLRVVYFVARYRNAIDFEEGPPPRLVNRDRMACDGVELSGRIALLETLDWQLGVTRAIAELPGTDEQLRNRPRWTGSSQAVWRPLAAWQLSLGAIHVGRNLDSSIPTGDRELPAYTRVDGAIEWRVFETLALRAALENALDADYEELVGFPGPRRGARLELRASL